MRGRRRSGAAIVALALGAFAAALLLGVASGGGASPPPLAQVPGWHGFVGDPRPAVSLGDRMIVVLETPSVAQRLARARYATEAQERSWTAQAMAAQQQVLTTLATAGIVVTPDERFARVLDGFSATLDPRAVALLERDQDVAGVYPVRAAFPTTSSRSALVRGDVGELAGSFLPGDDGRGVTVALLDTGVDLAHPYLRRHVLPGIDVLGGSRDAHAQPDPQDPTRVERHGTELAGIVVGADGPDGLAGVAPGATLLPIRVAGWQPDADGGEAVYARSDQLIAGLDRAVDPNGDGDCHDAARVALVGLAEPYAAFADSPEARAVQGALALGTVVVAPAGNDGAAGPTFGSVAGPAGAPDAVAVAADDARPQLDEARVVLRRGLDVLYDSVQPLLGPVVPSHALTLAVAAARDGGATSADFFTPTGASLVAGKAAVLPIGPDPQAQAQAAAAAGASAVLLYGEAPPAGALRVASALTVPVAWLPVPAASALLAARRAGLDVEVALGSGRSAANAGRGLVAGFSSRGLAFDGRVKPDVAAPGVGVATAEPRLGQGGAPLYGTVNGTSAAAAVVAGAAARLAEMRPNLDGEELRSLLVGYAATGRAPMTEVGAGTLRIGASAAGEVAADQGSLGFGIWQGPRWHATRALVIRNVSTRRLQLSVAAVTTSGESEALHFRVEPNHLLLREGQAARVRVTVTAPAAPPSDLATGAIEATPAGGETLRIPWALAFAAPTATHLLQHVSLDRAAFKPSDTSPAILSVQVGDVLGVGTRPQIEPVSRLDVLLYRADGSFRGVMARLRDLLPGSYSFGITGRGPTSAVLPSGSYELRLAAWPTLPAQAKPSRAIMGFRIR